MDNKQQTAVEWFNSKIKQLEFWVETKQITWKEYHKEKDKSIEQAKEMEKERIETAYNKGTVHGIDYPESALPITGEQYYNETYGGGEQ
jgi:23S rRNA pseudoU1915 N3-methylase RlmH